MLIFSSHATTSVPLHSRGFEEAEEAAEVGDCRCWRPYPLPFLPPGEGREFGRVVPGPLGRIGDDMLIPA